MMGNKWMQGGILFGLAIGLIVGMVLSFLVHPTIIFGGGMCVGFLSMWICGNARGTDGWGGHWNGPKKE